MKADGSLPYSQHPSTCSHNVPSHFCKIRFNIIIPSTLRSAKWSLCFRFPHQNLLCISLHIFMYHITHPSHSSWLGLGSKPFTVKVSQNLNKCERSLRRGSEGHCWTLMDTDGHCWTLMDTDGHCWTLGGTLRILRTDMAKIVCNGRFCYRQSWLQCKKRCSVVNVYRKIEI